MNVTPHFIIICHEAFLAAGTNNLNLINVFTQINANKFPFMHPRFALVVNFDIDTGGSHTIRTGVIDPAGKEIANMEMPVSTNAGNWQVIVNFEQMQYAAPGAYTFRLTIDGAPLGERVLAVRPLMAHSSRKPNLA